MTDEWTDRIVGDRMTVDQEFTDRVASSQFSRQQWGLIMTAVEFEIENPGDPDGARLVADTSHLPDVIPELDEIEHARPGAPGGGDKGQSGGGGGLVEGLRDALGFGGSGDDGPDEDRLAEAERLVQEYAQTLQTHLENRERWADIRTAAADAQ